MGEMKGGSLPLPPKDKFLQTPLLRIVRGGVLPGRRNALGGPTESQM